MCGICGYVSRTGIADAGLLTRMNQQIVRRGPDGYGESVLDQAGLAMRRLAIIDLEGGQQPIFNEDESMAIVFNGEIYNYKDLRKRLAAKGHKFRTHSDTEVVLHLYEEYGISAPTHLEGMFAFAIWDRTKQTLVLARDRLGIKPLHISDRPEGFFFGSEIKSLLVTGLIPAELDYQAVDEYLTYTFVPGTRTIYRHISQVPPGTTLSVVRGKVGNPIPFWSLRTERDESYPESYWLESTESALRDAVSSHMVSDVPVGAFLSGGVDSGVMVALMAQFSSSPIDAFTVGFQDAGSSFLDERTYARTVAKRYSIKHHEIDVKPNLEEVLPEIVAAFDQPFADDSVLPSYYVCKVAATQVKVALTGLGGDELFGGYKRHLGLSLGEKYRLVPEWIRSNLIGPSIRLLPESKSSSDAIDHLKRFIRSSGKGAGLRYQDSMATLPWLERQRLLTSDIQGVIAPERTIAAITGAFGSPVSASVVERALQTDIAVYLPGDLLQLTDRLSMWHSLELRVPFLDHRLVELAARIPTMYKVRGTGQKILLKKLAERWLPNEVIYHKKQGFEAPMGRWLRGPLLKFFDATVSRRAVEDAGIFDYMAVKRIRDEHVAGVRKHSKIMFSLLMFHAWWTSRRVSNA